MSKTSYTGALNNRLQRLFYASLCFSLSLALPRERAEYTPEALADQVDWSTLPGAEELAVKDSFNMFSGYINVDQNNGRNIFYWFMEAQEKPEDAPVVRRMETLEAFTAVPGRVFYYLPGAS